MRDCENSTQFVRSGAPIQSRNKANYGWKQYQLEKLPYALDLVNEDRLRRLAMPPPVAACADQETCLPIYHYTKVQPDHSCMRRSSSTHAFERLFRRGAQE